MQMATKTRQMSEMVAAKAFWPEGTGKERLTPTALAILFWECGRDSGMVEGIYTMERAILSRIKGEHCQNAW